MAGYCGYCGLPLAEGRHDACARRLELEPPRHCPGCRRRMAVQVTPDRWTARCAEHGEITVSTWTLSRRAKLAFVAATTESPALSYRCAPWTRAQGVDPIGSALTCDTLVLIETPPPWPRDVGEIPAFADLQRRGLRRTRLLAVRPPDDRPGRDERGTRVTIWRRADSGLLAGTDHVVASERLADGIARLLEEPQADGVAPPEVLLCGHGARDRCCGNLGTRLALDVAGAWPGVRVRRCSHTGGHRFAPTGFTLPDGRSWGFLDAETLDAIVRRAGAPPLRGHYRGNTALDAWGQAAERELFERFGWAWLDHQLISARTETVPGQRSATVELAWRGPSGQGTATVRIDAVRDVPVLACGNPPELAGKTAPELAPRSASIR